MPLLDKLAHAKHNYDVCHFLNDSDMSLNDWIVTTAFYSAIHFCQKGLFPGDYYIDSVSKQLNYYDNFEELLIDFKNSSNARQFASPHKCRRWLIESQVKEISYEYSALSDNCHTARYKDYKVGDEDRKDSLDFLSEIKSFCE